MKFTSAAMQAITATCPLDINPLPGERWIFTPKDGVEAEPVEAEVVEHGFFDGDKCGAEAPIVLVEGVRVRLDDGSEIVVNLSLVGGVAQVS